MTVIETISTIIGVVVSSLTIAGVLYKGISRAIKEYTYPIITEQKLQMQILKAVEEQTKITNGRVTKHDDQITEIREDVAELKGKLNK